MTATWSTIGSPWPHRTSSASRLARGPQRVHVIDQRVRPSRSPFVGKRAREEWVGRDAREQVVARQQDPPLLVPEDRVRGAVAGSVKHAEAAVTQGQRVAVIKWPGHAPAGSEGAERHADRAQHGGEVVRDAMAAHDRLRELVVRGGAGREVLQVAAQCVERSNLGPRAAGDDLQQTEVVHVLVGDHDQLEFVDRSAVLGQCLLELVERLARVRPRIDEGERLVLDQVTVHPANEERSRDRS